MEAGEIRSLLQARPFKTFKIFTTRTGSYVISDPSHVLVMRGSLIIGTTIGQDGIIDDHVVLSLAQISRVEIL